MKLFYNETIYGIDVHQFSNNEKTSFQLTFDNSQTKIENSYDVKIVNLLSKEKNLFDNGIGKYVIKTAYENYILKGKIIEFSLLIESKASLNLLHKILRWIKPYQQKGLIVTSAEVVKYDTTKGTNSFLEIKIQHATQK